VRRVLAILSCILTSLLGCYIVKSSGTVNGISLGITLCFCASFVLEFLKPSGEN
jgi:hypothetical protein